VKVYLRSERKGWKTGERGGFKKIYILKEGSTRRATKECETDANQGDKQYQNRVQAGGDDEHDGGPQRARMTPIQTNGLAATQTRILRHGFKGWRCWKQRTRETAAQQL